MMLELNGFYLGNMMQTSHFEINIFEALVTCAFNVKQLHNQGQIEVSNPGQISDALSGVQELSVCSSHS